MFTEHLRDGGHTHTQTFYREVLSGGERRHPGPACEMERGKLVCLEFQTETENGLHLLCLKLPITFIERMVKRRGKRLIILLQTLFTISYEDWMKSEHEAKRCLNNRERIKALPSHNCTRVLQRPWICARGLGSPSLPGWRHVIREGEREKGGIEGGARWKEAGLRYLWVECGRGGGGVEGGGKESGEV